MRGYRSLWFLDHMTDPKPTSTRRVAMSWRFLINEGDGSRGLMLNANHSLASKSGKTVTVYGLGDHGSDQQQLLESLQAKMTVNSDFRILLMHGSVSDKPMKGPTVKSDTVSDLLSQGFIDYVALGHNHRGGNTRPSSLQSRIS